jgi:hypothetical protein
MPQVTRSPAKKRITIAAALAVLPVLALEGTAFAGHHFMTANVDEYNQAINSYGYRYDGGAIGFVFDARQNAAAGVCNRSYEVNGTYKVMDGTGHWLVDDSGCVPGGAAPLYRLYKPGVDDHFYTMNLDEKQRAISQLGYVDEGVLGFAYPPRGAAHDCRSWINVVPLYRTYVGGESDHYYATTYAEQQAAVHNAGMNDEGIAACLPRTQIAGTVPIYRAFNDYCSSCSGSSFWSDALNDLASVWNGLESGVKSVVVSGEDFFAGGDSTCPDGEMVYENGELVCEPGDPYVD